MYPIQYAAPPPQPGLPPQQQSQQQQQHQQQQQQQQQQAPSPQPQQQQPEQPFHGHLQYAAMNMINPHFHPGYPPTQAYAPPPQAGARYPPHYPPALPPHPMHMIPHVQQPPFYQNPYQPYLPPSHFYNPYQSQPLPPPLPPQQQQPLQPQPQQAPPPRFNVRNVHSSSPTPLSHIRPFVPQSQSIPPQSHYTPPPREETHRMSPAPLPTPPSEPQIGLTFAPPEQRSMPNQERPTPNQQEQLLLVEATTIVTTAAAAAQPLTVSSPIAANRTPSPPLPPPVLPAPLPALSPVRLTPEPLPTTTTTTTEVVPIPPESPTTPLNTRLASEGGQPVELEEETTIGPTSTHPSIVFLTDDDSQSSSSVRDLPFTVVSFHPERIIDMNSVSSSLFISVGARLPEVFRLDALPPIPMENVDKQKKKKRKSVVKPSSSSTSGGGASGKTKSKKGKRVFPANGRLVGTSSPLSSSSSSSPGQNPNVAVAAVAVTTSSEESSTAGGRGGIAIIVEEEKEAGDANANVTNPTVVVSAEEGASEPTTTTTAAVRPAPKPAPLTKSFASLLRRSGGGGGTGGGGEGSDGQQARPAFLPSSQVGFTVPAMGWSTSLSINNNAIGGGGGGGGAYSANGSGNDVEEQSAVASLTPHQHASLIRLLKTGVGIPAPTSSAAATAAAKKSTTTGSTSTSLKAPPSGQQLSSTASASSSSLSHPGSNAPQIVPRGLVNTGNLCFANAILQSLVYTPPFWKLFNDLGQSPLMRERRNARSRGATTTTPMVDAVIDFLNEFKPGPGPIDSTNFPTASAAASMPVPSASEKQATSGGGSTSRSVSKEPGALPRNSFKASGVYNSLKSNPHFDAMRLGQQEDAEEFLGFFLDGLHEEFGKLLSLLGDSSLSAAVAAASTGGGGSVGDGKSVVDDGMTSVDGETDGGLGGEEDSEWQEVGRKNRAMVTRTTKSSESAITSIFGGKIRSVLRASGRMDSASVEEWRCLQLDIQPQHVRSIEDALYGVSTIETVSIQSRQGHQVDATKQVFLEHLPPILVLQLKRFIYDPLTGIGKSTKHVQYGPELDIRSDLVSPNLKSQQGGRKYKLYGVIYHHGLSATGGHYTLDVLHPHPSMYATTSAPVATSTTSSRPKSNTPINGTSQQQQPQTTEGWVRFNDESVRLLTPEDVFGKSGPNPNVSAYSASVAGTLGASNRQYQEDRVAYLLLYRRVGR